MNNFMCLVDITILIPVLLKKELLTFRDMEELQLPTMTESAKKEFIYLKLLRLGEEEYIKFMDCLKDPNANSHPGHAELYQKLSTMQC